MKHDVVIVGNGLFGSIAARLARAHGHNVTVVSDDRKFSASKASGCVLAPTWLSSLTKEEIATAMGVLEELFTVIPMEFKTNLLKTFKAARVDPRQVLVKPDHAGTVVGVGNGWVDVQFAGETQPWVERLQGKVLLATGFWTAELLPEMPRMRGLWGSSVIYNGLLPEPRIHAYAPYRQAVAFQMRNGKVWMGDGTALVGETWVKEYDARTAATVSRGHKLFKLQAGSAVSTVGVRPYVEGHKGGYFEKVMPKTWVATGGAKNGTVLAALHAHRFLKEALK